MDKDKRRITKDAKPATQKISVFDDPPRANVLLLSCMDQRLLDDTVKFMNALNLENRYDQISLAGSAMGVLQLPSPDLPVEQRWQGVFQTHLYAAINVLNRPIKDIFLVDHLDCGAYRFLHPDAKVREKYAEADLDDMVVLHHAELKKLAARIQEFIHQQRAEMEKKHKDALDLCQPTEKDKSGSKSKTAAADKSDSCWDYVTKLSKREIEAWSNIRVSYFVMDLFGNVKQLDVPKGERDTLSL